MPRRKEDFTEGQVYHIFNRGVEKRSLFLDANDFYRFLNTFFYYLHGGTIKFSVVTDRVLKQQFAEQPRFTLIAYCFMPNHYHVLFSPQPGSSVANLLRRVQDSYAKYFNTRYERVGGLFQGPFKAVWVKTDEQLLHLVRYIHLNPVVAGISKRPHEYPWSSCLEYLGRTKRSWCQRTIIEHQLPMERHLSFLERYQEYLRTVEALRPLNFD